MSRVLKIAALAEAYRPQILCHNHVGPIVAVATTHLYASARNVATMEHTPLDETPPRNQLLARQAIREGGYLRLADRVGLGYATIDPNTLGGVGALEAPAESDQLDGGFSLR